jgi:hypothetical protein
VLRARRARRHAHCTLRSQMHKVQREVEFLMIEPCCFRYSPKMPASFKLARNDVAVSTKAVDEKFRAVDKMVPLERVRPDYAVQRLNMLFEHRPPTKRLLFHLRICFAYTMSRYRRKLLVKSSERSTRRCHSNDVKAGLCKYKFIINSSGWFVASVHPGAGAIN